MIDRIPAELRTRAQWVGVGPGKEPLNPHTRNHAAVDDPRTWGTYEQARAMGTAHVGFVLTADDPYALIDLDNKEEKPPTPEQLARQAKILEYFDSYTERSQSGRGFHIVLRGRVAHGARRDDVEVYSSGRYMICTGDVVRDAPITDQQAKLDLLMTEMRPRHEVELTQHESHLDDADLIDMAMRAANAAKFDALCKGEWQGTGEYPSQSEADFALLSILCFYTRDNDQVARLFLMSALGQRDKARRTDYVQRCLRRIRAAEPPPVDTRSLEANAKAAVAARVEIPTPRPVPVEDDEPVAMDYRTPSALQLPPGVVGELAHHIYGTVIRPVPEVALLASMALVAGIVGRSYNVSGTGLNQYLVILAKTGSGKEGAPVGIESVLSHVRAKVPAVDQFLGPAAFASGQSLIRVLDERPCFISLLPEFGITLQRLLDPRATVADRMLKQAFLDLYTKSGWSQILRPTVYSDTAKNTKMIHAPSLTLLGESTPEQFFEHLNMTHIAEGLISRFSIIEYKGERPPMNRNVGTPPPEGLIARLSDLAGVALTTMNNHTVSAVTTDPKARVILDAFNDECDQAIRDAGNAGEAQLWNRAHLKALKLAALIAVGCNPHQPWITTEHALWARGFVDFEVRNVLSRFDSGSVGAGEARQDYEIREIIMDYLQAKPRAVRAYKVPGPLHAARLIPYGYIRRRCLRLTTFYNDRRGATRALKETIDDMVRAEILTLVAPAVAMQQYGVRAPLYGVGARWE